MKLSSQMAGVAALAGLCLATTTSAQSAGNSMAAFDGRTGLLNSCVALFAGAPRERAVLEGNYDVTLQLLNDQLQFGLTAATVRTSTDTRACSGHFEGDTYLDKIEVTQVDAQTDGRYFLQMQALPGEPMRLRLNSALLTREIPAERFASAALYSRFFNGDALLVAKNGHIVFEDYVAPFASGDPHLLASGTKSFSVALFALGVRDGIWTLDEPVHQTITEWQGDAGREAITIRHLLNLSSGLKDSDRYNVLRVPQLDIYDLAINHSTQEFAAGTGLIYGSVNFYVLSALFERKTGQDPAQYLYDNVLKTLGMPEQHHRLWIRDIKGKPQLAGGAYLDARSWLNFGLMIADGGYWKGRQLLDPATLAMINSIDNPAYQGYGLSWWRNNAIVGSYQAGVDSLPPDAQPMGDRILPDQGADLYFAGGLGRQRLYILPSQNLVIVRFGMTLGDSFSDQELLKRVQQAFQ
ncbi:class C beta-lactamase-related serine hydrolase [Gammaproteobacteria bacterium LSUCC0112]|nr:class C beta-lactamase-related serine hydrolase [Gammaproteobacteria bacterium LSUCC0112]